jgi:hypothetical protein
MKKVVLASLLACLSAYALIGSGLPSALAQDASAGGAAPAAAAGGQVQMPAAEYAVYNNAMTQTDPKAKAAAIEGYLTQFPQSAVKLATLVTLMATYSTFDSGKTLDAADRVLQLDPTNLRALTYETYLREAPAQAITDPAAKQTALDTVASYAQKGLTAFKTLTGTAYPIFYSAIGFAAFNKKDFPGAIEAYKKELTVAPEAATKTPGSVLLDIYYMGIAYYQSTPPDYLNCTFYATRAAVYAPDAFKTQTASPAAKYCYTKFHGNADGYDAVVTAATANLNPPDGLFASIKPAPTPADFVNQVFATTPDLSTLNPGDREFILQNGTPDQAAKIWDTMKGKSVEIPGALVIASSPTQIQVAISDDAVQSKTADFTFNMAAPDDADKKLTPLQAKAAKAKADAIAAATAVGKTITIDGTYDSYTPKPIMITMTNGAVVLAKAATPKPAVRHTAAKK